MKVESFHASTALTEADVVESFIAGSHNLTHFVIGDKEVLLPPHEEAVMLGKIRNKVVPIEGRAEGRKQIKAGPMLQVHLFVCVL